MSNIGNNIEFTLLAFAGANRALLALEPNHKFSKAFVSSRSLAFRTYHDGLIISNSHGINYFDNVIKYWNDPISYLNENEGYKADRDKNAKKNNRAPKDITEKDILEYKKKPNKDDYEMNFVLVLLNNKEKHAN